MGEPELDKDRRPVGLEKLALMPDWPGRLSEDCAALYLGIGRTTFRQRVASRTFPQPIREGGRLLWSRRQLDRFIDGQFGFTDRGDTWADL